VIAAAAVPKSALFVAASDQSLSIPSNSTVLGGAVDLAFSAWVKLASKPHNMVIASKDDDLSTAGSEYFFGYEQSSDRLLFQVEGSTTFSIKGHSFGSPPLNTWIFISGWYDHTSQTVNVQVNNGVVNSLAAEGTTHQTATPFTLGADGNIASNVNSYMDGQIDQVRFFRRLTTQAERYSFYASTNGSNTNPGTLHAGATYSADVPSQLAGNVNSVNFNGGADCCVLLPTTRKVRASSLWFKPVTFTGMLLSWTGGSSSTYLRLVDSSTIRPQSDSNDFKTFTVPTMTVNTWHHLVFTRGPDGLSHIYLDGVESSSGGLSQPLSSDMTINEIGNYFDRAQGSQFAYQGKMADVQLFFDQLIDSDIALLAAGNDSVQKPITRNKMNEGSGITAIDSGTDATTNGQGVTYANLPVPLQSESTSTFVSSWEFDTAGNLGLDSRGVNNLTNNNGVTQANPVPT